MYGLRDRGQDVKHSAMSVKLTKAQIAANIRAAAERALAEAEARRAMEVADDAALRPEFNGQKGPEPTRYGDWEKKGLISDF